MLKRLAAAALVALAIPSLSLAELPKGARAPVFATQSAQGGKVMAFNLRSALRRGPVVLYFYPKSFTQGCTLEANAFAEAMADFSAAGATVIGLSADTIETQLKFSTEACRDKFPVGVASPAVIKAYKVDWKKPDGSATGLSSRTSYVIGRDGTIKLAHSDLDYRDHVRLTLEAVRALKAKPHH